MGLQWVPRHLFLPGNDPANELARRGALLVPSVIPCSLLSLVSIHSFSQTEGVLSHLDSSTRRSPQFPLRNLCSFVTLAVFSLVFVVTGTAYCCALINLELAESRILSAAPADTRSRTPLISLFTVQLRTLSAAHSLTTLYDLWSRPWGVARLLGLDGLPPWLFSRKGLGNNSKIEIMDALLRNKES